MAKKKTSVDVAAGKMADALIEHMETLSPKKAKAMRHDIHKLALKRNRSL